MSDKIEIQMISAPWCKRCHAIKPDVAQHASAHGATFVVIDFDEMEESEKSTISSLPTIRMRLTPSTDWQTYTANTVDDFKKALVAHSFSKAEDF